MYVYYIVAIVNLNKQILNWDKQDVFLEYNEKNSFKNANQKMKRQEYAIITLEQRPV